MNKFLNLRLNRFVPVGLIALAAAVLIAPAPADATPFVVKLRQQGNNVIATGYGSINLESLICLEGSVQDAVIIPTEGLLQIGPVVSTTEQCYSKAFAGPSNFGTGGMSGPWSGGGDFTGVYLIDGFGWVSVPPEYANSTPLSSFSIWEDANFASLGVTPGTYVWTWGRGADQSFTLIIGGTMAAPEPAALDMFGFGVLLIGAFVGLRGRVT